MIEWVSMHNQIKSLWSSIQMKRGGILLWVHSHNLLLYIVISLPLFIWIALQILSACSQWGSFLPLNVGLKVVGRVFHFFWKYSSPLFFFRWLGKWYILTHRANLLAINWPSHKFPSARSRILVRERRLHIVYSQLWNSCVWNMKKYSDSYHSLLTYFIRGKNCFLSPPWPVWRALGSVSFRGGVCIEGVYSIMTTPVLLLNMNILWWLLLLGGTGRSLNLFVWIWLGSTVHERQQEDYL